MPVIFYFLTNYSPSKTMKNAFYFIEKALFVIEIFNYLYFHLLLFFPCRPLFSLRPLKINLEVYDVINCQNKNLITILFDILRRKTGMKLKLCQLIEYLKRNIFIKKSRRKCALKASPRPFLNFHKQPNTTITCKKFF